MSLRALKKNCWASQPAKAGRPEEMRKPQTGQRRRKDQIGWSKVLTIAEQKNFWHYLRGEMRSTVTRQFSDVEAIGTRKLVLICDLFFCTGLRETELAQLRVQDTPFVLGQDVIEIYRGKGNKDRTIQLSHRLAAEVTGYIKTIRPKTMSRYIKRSDISRPVFYSRQGRPYLQHFVTINKKTMEAKTRFRASTALYRAIRRIGEHAGIAKHIYPHMFRHTFAVNALLKGVDIYLLQELMGHSDITMTARYLHLVNAQLKGLGEKLDFSFLG